jgi:hypothetical protein
MAIVSSRFTRAMIVRIDLVDTLAPGREAIGSKRRSISLAHRRALRGCGLPFRACEQPMHRVHVPEGSHRHSFGIDDDDLAFSLLGHQAERVT